MSSPHLETSAPAPVPSRTIRRGFLAAAWAAVAAVVLRQTTEPVEAGADADVVLGGFNTTSAETIIANSALNEICLALSAPGDGGVALSADGGGIGVYGSSMGATGVLGSTRSGIGVKGQVPAVSNANAIAVYGSNLSTYVGPGPGAGGFGVYGLSAKGHGLVGAVATAGAAAVVGAVNGVVGAYAGAFCGPVVVGGNFTVVGGAKSAAVPHPDGTHRRLYCVESPESWFEDFGEGQLDCGVADVTIDPDFAAVASLNAYHVFLTGYDDFELRVSERTPSGFRVQAKAADASGRFSWRVVEKRKDIAAPRFETVTVPLEPVLPDPPPAGAAVRDAAPPPMDPVRLQRRPR